MNKIIKNIITNTLGISPIHITEIKNFGSVNLVFDITCPDSNYIIRLNKEESKRLEFLKEEWCIQKVNELGILVPKVLHNGIHDGYSFMIQEKIEGVNGSISDKNEKIKIWQQLGSYASRYQQIKQIEIPELIANEFHKNWESKLEYNIKELSAEDSLLSNQSFTSEEHNNIKDALILLRNKEYQLGLTHGDLSPRNVIINDPSIYLLDWGTAEINIVPYAEIGIILIEGEAKKNEFQAFLKGLGISNKEYSQIELEIRILNILHRLDKYRWASSYDIENIDRYIQKLKQEYQKMIALK